MGAHFPVADKYPADATRYRPALPRGPTAAVTEMKLPENLVTGAESWRRYRHRYRHRLLWTGGVFFAHFLARGCPPGELLVSTSAPGQAPPQRCDTRHTPPFTHPPP